MQTMWACTLRAQTSIDETESVWAFRSTCGMLAEDRGVGSDFLFLDTTHKGHCLQFLGREQKPRLVPGCLCILGYQGTTKH